MSVKEILRKSSAQFIDVSPVLPDGVRIVTREKSASEVLREEKRWLLLSENQVVNVHEDWELRWW
ncbi:MAG TPA: hypothetical protein VFK02_07465, partial [Kofleriaceae bacterium]|nr:hypothetical protein [Kofleriaceae bacterium]